MSDIEEIVAEAQGELAERLRAVFQLGVAEGRNRERRELRARLFGDDEESTAAAGPDMFPPAKEAVLRAARAKRAPKGLTQKVMRQVFDQNPNGLKMEAVQNAAVAIDGRIAPKTVYNELYRRPETYVKDDEGNWHMRSQVRAGNAGWHNAEQRSVQ